MKQYILSIDQGTSSSRSVLFDLFGNIVSSSQKEIEMIYQKDGYVEQDAYDIWTSVLSTMAECLLNANVDPEEILSIGITNQRETTVLWDRKTGLPVYKAIVWQSNQSSEVCELLEAQNLNSLIRSKTGLLIDPYFSASKIKWVIDNIKGVSKLQDSGDLMFGTVDSWLLYKLTGNKEHKTDYSNASRTLLFNIHEKKWDDELCSIFNVNKNILPEVCSSDSLFGYTSETTFFGASVPITGILGDQQAALFGQRCFDVGDMKNTYGTGCFMLMNTGKKPYVSKNGLLTTIGYSINNEITYALEGSVFVAGSAIQWLRDGLKFFNKASESEESALQVEDNGGVVVVPTFVGLGSPYWDSSVKGAMFGLTRATTKHHIARATLESLAYQTKDIINSMNEDSNIYPKSLKVDGGASNNDLLMQFQSDILDIEIKRPEVFESTALGAMYMSAIGIKHYSLKDINLLKTKFTIFYPTMSIDKRTNLYDRWNKAINAVQTFK